MTNAGAQATAGCRHIKTTNDTNESQEDCIAEDMMIDDASLASIPGATAFRDWYGIFPSFHDANATLSLNQEGDCTITADGFRITNRLKPDGYFVLDKHFRITLRISGVDSVTLDSFQPGMAILMGLDIKNHPIGYQVEISGTYGLSGEIIAKSLEIEFEVKNED